MIEIEGPDGVIYEFPEGTTDEVIGQAMRRAYGAPAAPVAAPTRTRSQQLGDQMMAAREAGDIELSNRLMAEASRAAIEDGDAPQGVAINPATGRMEDTTLRDNGRMGAAMQGAGQGLGFGLMDEVVGGLYGLTGPGSFAENRDYAQTSMRSDLAGARENYPVTAYGSELLGGAATSIAGAAGLGMAAAPTLGGRAVQGAGIGAVEGGLYGFGSGEGGAANRATSAGQGALFGAAVGGAAPYAIEGVRQGFDMAVGGPLASMRSAPSEVRASRAVQSAVDRSGRTPQQLAQDIAAAQAAGQTQYGIADATGYAGQRMLAGAARTPGAARQEIVEYLANRQGGQGRRIAGAVDDGLNADAGFRGMTGDQVTGRLTEARGAQAAVDYPAARAGAAPVDVRGVLGAIDDRLGPMRGADVTGDSIDATFAQIRNRLAGETPTGDPAELSDFQRVLGVKQDVQDTIGRAQRAGEGNRVRELSGIVSQIDQALEQSSGGYRQANDNFARASRVIDQVDAGRAATSNRARTGDVQQSYAAMTPEQQAAFRAGYSDPLLARMESAAPGVNKARPLMDEASQAELGMMARDPQSLTDFLAREDQMFRTGNAAMGGSMTADNLADVADVGSFDANALVNLLTGRWGAAATQLGSGAINTMMGRNTATREQIARLLLSGDIDAALAPAVQKALSTGKQSAVVEALMRSLERTTNPN